MCWTAYANFVLSEKTVPLYHMQHWEEVFFADEVRRQMACLTYRLPLVLMANCSWLKETVRQRVGRDSWLLLPGVDTQIFHPRTGLQSKFANPHKVRVVTYYSPIPFKGWQDAVEAMKRVFSTVGKDRVEWLVYGGQPLGNIDVPATFVGRLFGEGLGELYSSAHIVFMPSWHESFPLPPIEAMASGAAAVVTGTGTEDYAFDGRNALVRPAKDPEQLANAILELVGNLSKARDLAEEGMRTASTLTWNAATDRLEAILEEAVGSRSAR
jgi:glycosyltransferase involved in cell wall biosynthesis